MAILALSFVCQRAIKAVKKSLESLQHLKLEDSQKNKKAEHATCLLRIIEPNKS